VLGTPDESTWPGISQNPFFSKLSLPVFPKENLRSWLPIHLIDDQGLDLLCKMLEYEPSKRITARQSLQHPYFSDVQLPF
jgi:serine/threonine protein kinase